MLTREQKKIFLVMAVAAIFIWTGDAVFDALYYHDGSIIDQLYRNVPAHEIVFRLLVVACFVTFGLALTRVTTGRQRAQEELQKHIAAVETSMDGIAIYDSEGNYLYVNQAYASINGYDSPQDIIGKSFRLVYEERSVTIIDQIITPTIQKSGRWRGELIAKRKNGSTYYQEASVSRLEDGGRVCIVRDITWRKRNEARLRRSEQFLNMIFNSIRDPFCILDGEFQIIRANEAYALLKNKTIDELIGRKCYEVLNGRDSVCDACVVDKTFQSTDPCAKEKPVTLPNGTEAWMEIYTYPILDEEGKVSHVIEYTRDVTERKRSEGEKRRLIEKLEHLSRTDALTGLLNRRALAESLSYEMDRAGRYDSKLSLLLCDIDNFKRINDKYGHDAGDHALQTISATLKTLLRKTDIAGRYGGDEFMLILPETLLKGAERLAEKLRTAIENTEMRFPGGGKVLRLSMSVGVASLEKADESMDSFVKRADENMYVSKQSGRNRITSL
jgi:diguanylate cyclase (GGDEF)-like protein/PAS domain S-box-containing protein